MFVQPSGARDLTLQYGAVEGMLNIPRAECSDSLNDFESAEVRGMAHRRAPVAAPHRKMQHLRFGPQNLHDRVAIVRANRLLQFVRRGTRGDAMLERGPIRKTVFARDDELCVAQARRRRRDGGVSLCGEFRMATADPLQCVRFALAPLFEEFARLPLWDIEMGPLGQPA